jgi:NAD(P)-dependent dehydrogenase (short-subunit alcohol dehydrogenase family)
MGILYGKRLVITGAGSGIGRATSLLAAEEGASVVAVDLAESVEETAQAIREAGGQALSVQADVSNEEAVRSFIDRAVSEFGGLDGIYANAGIGGGGKPMLELTVEDWQRTLGVNTIGVFLAVKHAVPALKASGGGAILCTASVAGLRANAGGVDYSASKAGVISIVQTVAYQLYGEPIRINAICPGLIQTGMTKPVFDLAEERGRLDRIGQINPTRRFGQPREIAEMACFLLSDRASYVNGQAIPVDGGLSASHPWAFPRQQ